MDNTKAYERLAAFHLQSKDRTTCWQTLVL